MDMKRIPLTQGKFAIVDDELFEWLNQWKWCAHKNRNTYYAERGGKGHIQMHREILGLTYGDGKLSDHINHNGLDNRQSNIRICTNAENLQNQRPQKDKTSKYKGVRWSKVAEKWRAYIKKNKKWSCLGYFANEIDAAKAYNRKAKELFGEFACPNFL